ncbi:hypothetical protein L210DRAFT_3665926 [Boletus edulis BED1]|uniref:Uncharacterized protein n=1 Tax=Boletus edulis BED1 TaxID=1328754 RepID=A0AAD4G7N5_BOLED|nr:hypothetical protein L210DRAFT_3665926 [Boletus edulis BED1]
MRSMRASFVESLRAGIQCLNSFRPRQSIDHSNFRPLDSDVVLATSELPGVKHGDVTTELHQNRLTA